MRAQREHDPADLPSTTGRAGGLVRRLARAATALLAVAGLTAAGVLVAGSPAAAIAGLQIIPQTSVTSSSASKMMFIQCPGTTAGLGGDVEITGSTRVRILGIYPSPVNVGFLVAEPPGGVSENWSFTAHAICAPVSSLPGLQYVPSTVTEVALARGRVSAQTAARCPNKRVIGMGAEAYGEPTTGGTVYDKVTLTRLDTFGPVGDGGWDAFGSAVAHGFDGTVTVNVVAVCVDRSRIPTLGWVREESADNSSGDKLMRATCDGGRKMHGGGFVLNWTVSDDVGEHVGVNRLVFRDTSGRTAETVEVIAREDTVGTAADWQVYAVVICA